MRRGWAGRNTNSIRLRTSEKPRPVETRKMTEDEWKNRKRKA